MTITDTNHTEASESSEKESAILLQLDPRVLIAHPNNPRKKLTGIKELAQSVKLIGVVQPLVVTKDNDGYRIIAGHRRAAAAILAGRDTVPCVQDDAWGVSELAPLTAFVAENVNREGLTTAEEAEVYRQMQLLGMPVGDIAKTAGRKKGEITQAITVAESEIALALTARHDLTFDQAAAIAEFADDKDAVKELTVLAVRSPGSFEHRVSRLRQDRSREAEYQLLLADFTARGVRVIEPPEHGDKSTIAVRDLYDAKGNTLDPKKHEDCLGYAVVIESDWSGDLHVTAYCTRWKENGHQLRSKAGTSAMSGPEAAKAKAERREVIENNKAWRAAEPVRRQFVADLCARRSVPKGLLRYAVTDALSNPHAFANARDDIFVTFAKLDGKKGRPSSGVMGQRFVEQSSDLRLPLVLFVQIATSVESAMGVHTWRNVRYAERERNYLSFLASQGYVLSPVEQKVVDGGKAAKVRPIKRTPNQGESGDDNVSSEPHDEVEPIDARRNRDWSL